VNIDNADGAAGSALLLENMFSRPYCARELLQAGQLEPVYATLTNTSVPYNFSVDPYSQDNNDVSSCAASGGGLDLRAWTIEPISRKHAHCSCAFVLCLADHCCGA